MRGAHAALLGMQKPRYGPCRAEAPYHGSAPDCTTFDAARVVTFTACLVGAAKLANDASLVRPTPGDHAQDLAVLVAGLVGFALSNWLDPAALDAWGWRVAFLLGAAIVGEKEDKEAVLC